MFLFKAAGSWPLTLLDALEQVVIVDGATRLGLLVRVVLEDLLAVCQEEEKKTRPTEKSRSQGDNQFG